MSSNPQGYCLFCFVSPGRSIVANIYIVFLLVITAVDVFQSTLLTPGRLQPQSGRFKLNLPLCVLGVSVSNYE